MFCFVTYRKNLPEKLTCIRFLKNINREHFANAQMSILSFGFQSDRAPNRCTGPRVEGDWFSLQTPCSRRAFYLNKTMQLSKPIHGLRETFLHEFLQTVIFSE